MYVVLIICGIVIFVNGLFLLLVSNFNIGTIATLGLGLFFSLWGLLFKKIKKFTQKGICKLFKYIVITLLISEIILIGFIGFFGINDNVTYSEDVIIVLGAGIHGDVVSLPLKMRLDTAIEYHKNNPESVIVVTGGQGFQETVTEAYAMEKYLISKGIEKDKIIKEENATSTNENMRFSKQILDKKFNNGYKACIVTNNFHIYRATCIAQKEGIGEVTHIHCGLQWYNYISCYLRESLAVLKLWVIG
jgi:uncharacterized SAM-binding protein YcdF (DUF218 family)